MSRPELPRCVVVMPCLNAAAKLPGAVDAFLSQSLVEKKLVIVDGKSTDGSHGIIADYAARHPEIVWLRQPDSGISNALNLAMAEVGEGDVWGYLGADDILLPGVLERVAGLFAGVEGLDGAYFDSYSHARGRSPVLRRCPEVSFSVAALLKHGTVVGLQNFYCRGALVRRFAFNEGARYSMDYELYLRLASEGFINFIHVPEPSTVNAADGNISTRYAEAANLEALGFARAIGGWTFVLLWRYCRHFLGAIRRRLP